MSPVPLDEVVSGRCDPRFERVARMLGGWITKGRDVGASLAVVVDGEPVVDVWGGYTDEERTQPWQEATITNVWSITKPMAALATLVLVDRGQLDLDAPVCAYWPEFAQAGKQSILVRHVLGHTAALPGWKARIRPEDLFDHDRVTGLLARQRPWWRPGTWSGYHAVTQGFLLGELVRRVTGQTIGRFFAQEIAGPLQADFHISLPQAAHGRAASVIPAHVSTVDRLRPGTVAARTLNNPRLDGSITDDPRWRCAEIPAANGYGNARSVAAVQTVVAAGGVAGGRRFLSEQTCRAVFDCQADGRDLVLGVPVRFGLGYALQSSATPIGPNEHICFWGGWGGSLVLLDLDARLVMAYVMNRMTPRLIGDQRGFRLAMGVYAALRSRR